MADPNKKNGAQYVVANALFTCQYGVTPAQLQVTQNQKLLAQNKLVATDKEVQFNPPAQTFGVCSMNPNKQAGQPCLYAQGKWDPTTTYSSNGTNIVTEDSEMLCTMFAGKIKTIFPGQVASVSMPDLKDIEKDFMPYLLWEVDSEKSEIKKRNEKISFSVKKLKCGGKTPEKEKHLKIRRGEQLTFDVLDGLSTEKKKYVSWIVGHKVLLREDLLKKKSEKSSAESASETPQSEGSVAETPNPEGSVAETPKAEGSVAETPKPEGSVAETPKPEGKIIYDWLPYELYGPQFVMAFHHYGDFFVGAVGYGTEFYNNQIKGREESYYREEPTGWKAMFFVHVQENSIESVSVEKPDRIIGDAYYVKKGKKALPISVKTELPYDKNSEEVSCQVTLKGFGPAPVEAYHYKEGELEMKLEPGNVGQEYVVEFYMNKKNSTNESLQLLSSKSVSICFYDVANIKCTKKNWPNKDESGLFTKSRPGNDFKFEVVGSDGTSGENFDLIDWKILHNGKEIQDIKDQKSIAYNLKDIGKYVIKAFLNDTKYFSNAFQQKGKLNSNQGKEISHTIDVKNNTVEEVSLKPYFGVKYVGVEYPIELTYDFGEDTTNEERSAVNLKVSGTATVDKKRMVFKAFRPSNDYEILATLNDRTTSSGKICVTECEYSKWTFCDSKGNHIDKIGWIRNDGKDYEFGIIGRVPSWCYIAGTSKEGRKVKVILRETTKNIIVGTFQNIELSDEGEFQIKNIKSGEIVKTLVEKHGFTMKKDIRLMFYVYDAPSCMVKNLFNGPDWSLYENRNMLTITNGFYVEGSSFIDPDNGNKLIAIKKYGDKVKIRMQIINPGNKKLCLRIYENCKGLDSMKIEYEGADLRMDENGVVEIDVPTDKDGQISRKDHEESNSLPRVFYYILVDKNEKVDLDYFKQTFGDNNVSTIYKIVHSYPKSPGDTYDVDLNEDVPQNYFEQLKLVLETEENKFCKTYASLAPVVVGDEKDKDKKEDPCKCPNCDKDITLENIKSICSKKDKSGADKCFLNDTQLSNIQKILPYLNKYRGFAHIDTCTRKAHFIAQVYAETMLYKFEENDFTFSSDALKDESTKFQTAEGRKKANEWGYDAKAAEKDGSKRVVSKENQINIANWRYASVNGNGNFSSGDGYKYRGRGMLHLTGKGNYRKISKLCNEKFLINGEPATDWENNYEEVATNYRAIALSALGYWDSRRINQYAEEASDKCGKRICKVINNSSEAWTDEDNNRKQYFSKAVEVFKVNECKKNAGIEGMEKTTSTYDHKFAIKADEQNIAYIDVITPIKRNSEGVMVVFDNTGILFKTYCLCRGTHRNRAKNEGDTPTGLALATYNKDDHVGDERYGNYGCVRLYGRKISDKENGAFYDVMYNNGKNKNRDGILIHAGHTKDPDKSVDPKGLNDTGRLMPTHGCVRVYNQEMKKLAELCEKLKKDGKTVYLYVEDYIGDITTVYDYYCLDLDFKDKIV